MISQPIILLQRQHGVELGGPGQAMGLVEMELREDIVSQTIYSCFISSPEISITSGDLFLLLKFLHKIRFQRLVKISLRFALGVLDMDTITRRFIGNWSVGHFDNIKARFDLQTTIFQDHSKFYDARWRP